MIPKGLNNVSRETPLRGPTAWRIALRGEAGAFAPSNGFLT